MKIKKLLALALAAALILAAVPAFGAGQSDLPEVPEGFNAHDFMKCVTFLEQEDENGVKNGEKLSDTYDPNAPATRGMYSECEDDDPYPRFEWAVAGDGACVMQ